MARTAFENLEVYRISERLADVVWEIVLGWDPFARNTVGQQLVCAADSVAANIAEGHGRGSDLDNRRFVRIARGSANETKNWLRRAYRRRLLTEQQTESVGKLLGELMPKLNAYHRALGRKRVNNTIDPAQRVAATSHTQQATGT
jgi:four helix bundle protein